KLLAIASDRSGEIKVVSSRNPFCLRRIGRISASAMRLSSVAESALSFKVTCRPNISFSSVELWTSGDLGNSRGAEKGVSELDSPPPYTNYEYMSNVEYISYRHYISRMVYRTRGKSHHD